MYNPFLDREKALETIVYLSQTTQDVFHLMKVIYYAEKLHLEKYGQSIYGDFFMKMSNQPHHHQHPFLEHLELIQINYQIFSIQG